MHIDSIVVDLDGTLIENAAPYILIFKKLIFRNPVLVLCSTIMFLLFGPNHFTSTSVAKHLHLLNLNTKDKTRIKFNPNVLTLLAQCKNSNTKLILATGSDLCVANAIADTADKYFGIQFDHIIGSTNGYFCISDNKLHKVREVVNSDFIYIGNSRQDYGVWRARGVSMVCVGDERFMRNAERICEKSAIALLPSSFELPKYIDLSVNAPNNS